MSFRTFDDLLYRSGHASGLKRCALAGSESIHALEALVLAADRQLIEPILCGDQAKTTAALDKLGIPTDRFRLIHCATPEEAVDQSIRLILSGEAHFVMKGHVETGVMMKQMLRREEGLRTGSVVHSVAFAEIETHHKLLALTDAAILVAPTAEQKKQMIQNTVDVMIKMGWDQPKVAVLAAVEKVNPNMPASVDAAQLKQRWLDGEIKNCIVEGPISFDLAISTDAAIQKKYISPVAGEADLMIYPDINAGNIALKTLTMTGHNRTGSVILGLKCPVVMSSRGASAENKLRSLLLAATMT